MTRPLADDAARERIATDLDSTLFVNAGAGSGKTASLVGRVVSLVLVGGVPMRHIAAVTFTERAGAELRDRLREEFEKAWRGTETGADSKRAAQALEDLDGAAIGTLHSFAQRVLLEHPIEAGLPPRLEVLDEVGSSVAFDDRWDGLRAELLDQDEIADPLMTAMALGVKLDHIRSLTQLLTNDWDLLAERVLRPAPPAPSQLDLSAFFLQAQQVLALRERCQSDDDILLARLHELGDTVEALRTATDTDAQIALLQRLRGHKLSNGRNANWGGAIEDVRADAKALCETAGKLVDDVLEGALRTITRWVAQRVIDAAEARRKDGALVFHDLLVLARDVLRRHASVREALHARYQRILLDEFQDTDPIQIELAVRIAAGADGGAERWEDVAVPAGRLFVVGDPKQSIYRFRRASIKTYLNAQDEIGETVSLTTNFRTVEPVLDWVNAVFGELIQYEKLAQPAYEALDHHRPAIPDHASVTVLGADAHEDLPRAAAAMLREREAADVAAAVRRVVDDGWSVQDRRSGELRPARLDDVAILIPARTSLSVLEEALDAAGVPYRTESSSLVYAAEEVRSLLACARAIADTTDGLALVQALRSSVFGCGDDDLWRWKQAGGSFTIYSNVEALADGPVGTALAYLKDLSFRARWLTPSELLGTIVRDRRMLEVAAARRSARDSWRRLRFVVDQARAWSEFSHGGLRAYLAWAMRQGQDTARVAEAVLPETDTDAVRIMTVHAAKGLEFPVVVLSGMTSQPQNRRGVQLLWTDDGGYAVSLRNDVRTEDFAAAAPIDEQMGALEVQRLLYVAATRARDHLVVSLHRKDSSDRSAAQQLAGAGAVTDAVTRFSSPRLAAPPVAAQQWEAPPDWAAWFAELTAVRDRAAHPSSLSASGLEGTEPEIVLGEQEAADSAALAGTAKGARDLELPPWSKGRYGSAVGRAVHGVLQVVDLATGDGLDQAVGAQSLAEGVLDHEDLVRSLARSALASDLVQAAAKREHWRETYVGCPREDGTVLEGYVDLVFRDDDGALVVVDYKTDAVPAGAIPSRVAYYKPQLDAYREALAAATGAAVRTQLLFLHPDTATAVPV